MQSLPTEDARVPPIQQHFRTQGQIRRCYYSQLPDVQIERHLQMGGYHLWRTWIDSSSTFPGTRCMGHTAGHVQSLLLGVILLMLAAFCIVLQIISEVQQIQRKLVEDQLERTKEILYSTEYQKIWAQQNEYEDPSSLTDPLQGSIHPIRKPNIHVYRFLHLVPIT